MDLTPWIDSEAKLKLPITKETLEKAVRLGTDHAFRLQQNENIRIIRQRLCSVIIHSVSISCF